METNSFEWWEDGAGADDAPAAEDDAAAYFGRIYLEGEFLNHDILKVSIVCEKLETPVLGMAFHLSYDPEVLGFLRYDPGSFLERGGDPFYLVSAMAGPGGEEIGKIVFGETLRRGDQYPVGDGLIAGFYFQELSSDVRDGTGSFKFEFENGVVSTLDTVRQDIDGVLFERLELEYLEVSVLSGSEGGSGFDPSYLSANAGGSFEVGGWIVWVVIACGIGFSAAFWYFFKRKKAPKFADFGDGR